MELAPWLAQRIGSKRGDIAGFAKKVGLSPQQITNVLAGRRLPKAEDLDRWSRALGLGENDEKLFRRMVLLEHSPDQVGELVLNPDRYVGERTTSYDPNPIPMVGTVVAGDGMLSDESAYEHNGADNLLIPDSWRAVMVEGMSAYPVVYPGQIVLIDTNRAARPDSSAWGEIEMTDLHDNLVLVETDEPPEIGKATNGKRAYLKRFCKDARAPDGFVLASIDSGRSSPYVPANRILMIVPVVGVLYQDPRKPRSKRWHAKTVVATIQP
jgi:transcriptional regulator with XRE-family HTH domain